MDGERATEARMTILCDLLALAAFIAATAWQGCVETVRRNLRRD